MLHNHCHNDSPSIQSQSGVTSYQTPGHVPRDFVLQDCG